MSKLNGQRVAILATDGFEQSELSEPKKQLEAAGAIAVIVSPKSGSIRGWKNGDWGDEVPVDLSVSDARVEDFDGLVLPGGQINPDLLRTDEDAMNFLHSFAESGKPVAAICHAPWSLAEANLVRGRTLTSYHSIRRDMENAGANWVDKDVVVDRNLITSRQPEDLDAFCGTLIDSLQEVVPASQTA